ncbi:hypothetical protein F2Q69_00018818 [Brassica cretica]|uniref:Uncharacterized protein n=1 Tax=Brassica cretica TaxID=69181 RepID=A0A8S9Q9F9_BRACR|nr:hypothetical protein F2Q69_00018818 [Brassica cretica]
MMLNANLNPVRLEAIQNKMAISTETATFLATKHFIRWRDSSDDVMGKIVSLEPVNRASERTGPEAFIFLSGKELACCLWGKYAEQLEEYVEREQPLICLIMFAKIGFYRGDVQITNAFDASIVYLDPTMEEALQFKEKSVFSTSK